MARRQQGNKPSFKVMMTKLTDEYISVSRTELVKTFYSNCFIDKKTDTGDQ